ncbi:phosphatase PAP2 family protein [Rhodotorula paludigena]|uniref:phosphatase PAP2 family protein n=1 Tax=Rhodotorula paludigena TaxID=86838 RepID=UPI00316E6CD3
MRLYLPPKIRDPLLGAVSRLEISFDVQLSLRRVKRYGFKLGRDWEYVADLLLALFSLYVMAQPVVFKLFLIVAYTAALLIPFTSQFFLPATPVFTWLLFFYSSQFIPKSWRPHIWVSVLPTLESVLYGANISDLLTRWTNPILDVVAWLPYGVIHFVAPFVVAAFLWVFSPPGAVKFWAAAFGYMNLVGVVIQIIFPCAPPWYELREGLVPANYFMRGSPGGLARIDALFGGHGYDKTFSGAPVPFGAFPSLHAGCSTMEALFLSHFFPRGRPVYWAYVFVLYWSTMYLTHHYLIDLVAGGSLSCIFFYYYLSKMPDELRHPTTHGVPAGPYRANSSTAIPLDEESGLPKTFAHTPGGANGSSNGHADGYGGWEEDDDASDGDDASLRDEARLFAAAKGRDSFDVPQRGDLGEQGSGGPRRGAGARV